ncbi:MAG TPA: non-homologous end-joining DNA ligase [Acidobacteriaceae bacterium]
MSREEDVEVVQIEGRDVRVTHPGKLYFSRETKVSKLDLVRYYLSVSPGALQGIRDRPIVLKRFVNGAEAEPFYQKRAPDNRPEWLRTVTLSFPSGRTAEEVVVDDAAGLAWIVNLGCIELHPHPVRTADLDHPDELRVDLDPGPGVVWDDVRKVALEVRALLEDMKLVPFVKTSGSRGIHINVRIEPRWSFTEVRRAALALSRAVERRVPALASSKWWKEERHGVFLDYNQNAKDRTTASAYSVRPLPDARVSAPLAWDEVEACEPGDFTVFTMPARFEKIGDPHAQMDSAIGTLDALLELAARDEAEGLGDAPWPPHFAKQAGEPKRVQPSKAKADKSFSDQMDEGFGAHRFRKQSTRAKSKSAEPAATTGEGASAGETNADAAPPKRRGRTPKFPLLIIAHSQEKEAALAGLARWKAKYPEAAQHLAVDDVLVDRQRGSAMIWYRIRVNLRHVPEDLRPLQETPDPDDDPTRAWREGAAQEAKQEETPDT